MKPCYLAGIFLLFSGALFGQTNIRWDSQAATTQGSGQLVPMVALPNAAISFYNACTSSPCTQTRATTYISANSTTTCPSGQQVVWQTSLNQACTSYADSQGRFGGYFQPGAYQYTVSAGGVQYGPFQFNVGGASSGGGGNPGGSANNIQINSGSNTFAADSNFNINTTTHTLSAAANMQINALSSLPRAIYDPMDTRYCNVAGTACGLQAAIAAGGTAPTQVIQAAIDAGECALLTGSTKFPGIDIPLPARVTIPIGGLLMWANSSIGGGDGLFTSYPNLQHNDATQYMISTHSGSDTITCNGTVYTPGTTTGVYVHDMQISGMGAVATNTDIGIYLNGSDAVVRNIQGGSIFGSSAIYIGNITSYGDHLGFPGGNIQGCATYNQGVLPVSSYTVGSGVCGSIAEYSVDGGAEFLYATDGMAIQTGHPAGPCYPNCAAVVAAGPGSFLLNTFAQISSIDVIIANSAVKAETLRLDWTSREALRLSGGGSNVSDVEIDSPCSDTALQANWSAGTATGCGAVFDASQGNVVSNVQVRVNDPFFSTSYDQCWIYDNLSGASGISNIYSGVPYQGNTSNTTANGWAYCGAFGGDQTSGRVEFAAMAPMQASTTTPNVSGITAISLNGQTVTNMVGAIPGQTVTVYGPGTINNQAGGSGDITNSSGLPVTLSSTQVVQYRNISTPAVGQHWQMTSGPPQLTPTHVNYSGNPTPSNPSLIDVYGNEQARQVPLPSFGGGFQLSGSTTTGQACFVLETLFPDASHAVSTQTCTNINIATAGGAVFGSGPNTVNGAITNLWIISDTQPSPVTLGKYPAITCTPNCFWSNTVVQAGGNGATPIVASDNTTGQFWAPNGVLLDTSTTQPTCTQEIRGLQWVAQGSGATADSNQICGWNGASYAWLTSGGGGGSVTNFSAGNLSPLFTSSVATATTTPALTFSLTTQAANTVFGNFTGSTAAPTFSATPTFSGANITSLNASNVSSGNLSFSRLSTMAADTLLGNASASTTTPAAINLLSCSSTSNALTYNTTTHTFGCNTISGSGTVNSGTATQVAIYASTGTAVSGDSTLTDSGTTLAYTGTGGFSLGPSAPTACGSATSCEAFNEAATAGTPTSAQCYLRADSASHTLKWSCNGSAEASIGSGGGSMVYPAAGVAVSTGTAWATSLVTNGTGTTINLIASTTVTVPATAVAANSCNSQTAVTINGVGSGTTFNFTPSSDFHTTTGWSAAGQLYFFAYPTTNTLNWYVCNPTSSSITPGASTTWNVSAR